ncbi:hypothetical protein F2P56_025851 [Juglans regia]|uniref:Uncharacterized protein n=1 Tax=Juglans regia TaxID=51240 RepID=A0A833UKX2_JUGRE|nr:hypothetical protein F2P56_025851 [Juglans regia]
MFLKGTCKDRSPANNHLKYLVSMALLRYMKNDCINPSRIETIYDVWMRKIGSMKDCPIEDKFVVHLEFILFCLMHDNIEEAHQAVLCVKQERELGADPISNMVLGLTLYQLWYSTIPKEIHWGDSDWFYSPRCLDMLGTRFINSVGNFYFYFFISKSTQLEILSGIMELILTRLIFPLDVIQKALS